MTAPETFQSTKKNGSNGDALPQFETFIENRESYIKALESTVEALRKENLAQTRNNLAMRSSIDEVVAMQRLANTVSTSLDANEILATLYELTRQVIPVHEANIFLLEKNATKLEPLSNRPGRLDTEAQQHLEAGIVDWVLAEKKTVIIPDLEELVGTATAMNFVIVPLVLRNKPVGIYVIHTPKSQQEFSNQDIQLLTVLANQAAAGVENWKTHEALTRATDEIKASQAQMIQAAKMAAIGELAANIVHEIKNPVQILMLHMDLVQKGRPMPNWTDLLMQQVKRLAEITKRLMNFSRSAAQDVTMDSFEVATAVQETVAIVQHEFINDKIKIEVHTDEELPKLTGSSNQLQQVLLNMLINARDAMPKGGTITVRAEKKNMSVVLTVTDTGDGIPPEVLPKIFTPFFTTKEAGKGTGLGLSICHKIIAEHKGTLTVDTAIGKGTSFIITLPILRQVS